MMNFLAAHPFKTANSRWKILFFVCAIFILAAMLISSFDFGITWDEWMQSLYGKAIVRYLITGGAERGFLKTTVEINAYGGLFDATAAIVYGLIFDSVKRVAYYPLVLELSLGDYYYTRHFMNALFGFAGVLFSALLARKIGGWRAGVFGLIFMCLSPRFFGNSMNNPKDIPFASMYILAVYFMACFIRELPKFRIQTILAISLGIAASINIKVGGLLLIPYLFLFSLAAYFHSVFILHHPINFLKLTGYVILASIVGYFSGLIFWPYAQQDPLLNPYRALVHLSRFSGAAGLSLFEGMQIPYNQLPWYYIPKWILISSPLFVVTGIIIFIFAIRPILKSFDWRLVLITLFTALFPVVYIILRKSIVYDSWRHLTFVYPSLIVIVALSWEFLFRWVKVRWQKICLSLFLILQLLEPLQWMVRNHPNEYVYFSPIVGGIDGANGKYETDYWGNCLREASEWLAEYHLKNYPGQQAVIRSDGEVMSAYPYLRTSLGNQYIPCYYPENFPRNKPYFMSAYMPLYLTQAYYEPWDYALTFSRGWPANYIASSKWPPEGTIYRVKADNTTLCAVVKNPLSRLH
jgi:hypothetical protein